eukprot:5699311-Prorocentrum_lima.AAC.1
MWVAQRAGERPVFSAHGGRLDVEKKLKWGCMQCHTVGTRQDHKDLPYLARDCLPSLAQLERHPFPGRLRR